jgi:hypothetical protein
VYGEARVSDRHKTWDILKFIKSYLSFTLDVN